MTQSIAVDRNNDIFVASDGRLGIVAGLQAVLQNAAHAAKTILGEMVLATDRGLPYFEAVWIGTPNLDAFEAALREAVLAVEGVTGISSLTIQQTGDRLTYAATIDTIYGAGAVNG